MKLALAVLGGSVVAAAALVSLAIAQPPARGAGVFAMLQNDANGDGQVTRAEFDAALKARFATLDLNGDGSATPDEVNVQRHAQAEERRNKTMTERFEMLDTNKNGQLSRAEFSARPPSPDGEDAHPPGRGPGPGDRGPMKRTNASADGTLTFEAFAARGAEAFNKVDANKDGVVTAAEIQTLTPQRRQ